MANAYWLQQKYDLSEERYDAMLRGQRGACAICRERMETPHVDHDHKSGEVRGLLCRNCNVGLGHFKDDIRLLANAIVYLQDRELE